MRLLSKISFACFILLGLSITASAQEGRSFRDFEFIRSSNPWLSSDNAAGLNTLAVGRVSKVEGEFRQDNGGLIDDASSKDSFKAGAMTETYMKLSESLALYGKLSYSYNKAKDMGGSILMDPSYNPINFYENVDTTRGIKNTELYHLIGGLAYTFKDKRWSLGVKVDYESGDRAKLKDPRFLNVWMDLGSSAGFRFQMNEGLSIGANFKYRRTVESIRGNLYGTSGKQYYTLIDYGGFFGERELFDGTDGMVTPGNTRPMFNQFLGGSIQLEAGRKTKIFNELTYLRRNGYFGNRGSTSIVYTEHGSNIIEYRGLLTAGNKKMLHLVGLDFRFENLLNYENVYRMSTETGEYTEVVYLSQNEVQDRSDISAGLKYTGYIDVQNFRPSWEFGAEARFNSRQAISTIYPHYRTYSHSNISFEAFGSKNILSGKNLFSLAAEALFISGFGVAKEDGALASSTSAPPRSFDTYLYRDFEYKTATRAGAGLTFRYTRLFSADVAAYIQLSDKYISLLKQPEYLPGGYRNTLTLSIGCAF